MAWGDRQFNVRYDALPTVRRFHASNSHVRAILGPVGCLPCDTEVMTPCGWIRIDSWNGEPILQWDVESKLCRFVVPKKHIVGHCDSMHRIDCGRHMAMSLTGNHRVPLYDWNGKFVVKSADAVIAKPSRHTIPTTWNGVDGDGVQMTDDELRLWVATAADGHYPARGNQCVFSFRRKRKIVRLEGLLSRMGIGFKKSVYRRSDDGADETMISIVRRDTPKHLDWRLACCTKHQSEVVLDEMSYWDGLCGNEYDRFNSTNRTDCDIIQYLAHSCGRNATISEFIDRRSDKWSKSYSVHPAKVGSAKSKVMLRCDSMTVSDFVPSDGKQYCFETDTGFFVVRQEGHIFITGNSGKSSGIIFGECYYRAVKQQPNPDGVRQTRVVMIRNTYNELTTTTLKTFREWWGDTICTYRADKPLSARIRFPLNDGTSVDCEVIFLAMDKPEDVGKLRSLEVTWGYINEASEIAEYDVMDALLERVGRYPKKWIDADGNKAGGPTWNGVVLDSNAPDDEHWIYQKFEIERPDGFEIFHQPPAVVLREGVNPAFATEHDWEMNEGQKKGIPAAENIENIPTSWDYYRNMLHGKDYEKIRVMMCGEYGTVAYGRPVYPEYSDQMVYLPNKTDSKTQKPLDVEILRGLPVRIGIDFGIEYSAAIFAQLSLDRQLRVVEELVVKDLGTRDFANLIVGKLHERYPGIPVLAFGDPCARARDRQTGVTDIDLLNEMGIPTVPAPTNDPRQRRESVVYFLRRLCANGQPGLVLGSRCPMLRKGFGGRYYYKKISTGRDSIYRPEPVKNEYSHPHDGLQYIATSLLFDKNQAEAAMMANEGSNAFGFDIHRDMSRPNFIVDTACLY